jgi:metal-responsive CopG/Arc/MetJ family transcriptional regulator
MKLKTSITLSDELVYSIDKYGKNYKNRSDFIEAAVSAFIKQIVRKQQDIHDIAIINRNAARINEEAEDVLEYQAHL